MSTLHTPGPWRDVDGRIFSDGYLISGAPIATVHKRKASGQYEANARLIAAAPELLEALRGLVSIYSTDSTEAEVIDARAAIAKAEGGAA